MTVPYAANWPEISRQAKEYYKWKCAVCDYDYKDGSYLTTHHIDYKSLGREKMSDLACLCWDHHPRGAFSKADIARWRTSYLLTKGGSWLLFLPFRLLWRLLRFAWRRRHHGAKNAT